MGIDTARFSGDIDGDLFCPICSLVLEEPIWAPTCEHAFCNTCITEWLTSNQTCPIDRTNLTIDALKPAPRILRNLLSRLTLSCSNQTHGCPAILTLERLEAHILECNFNPKRLVTCQSGCGTSLPFEELKKHNCFQCLKFEMVSQYFKCFKGLAILERKIEEKDEKVKEENEEKMKKLKEENEEKMKKLKEENEEKMKKLKEENEEKMSKIQSELDLLKAEIAALKKGNPEKQSLSSDSQLLPTAGQSQAVNQGTVLTDSRWFTKYPLIRLRTSGLSDLLVSERLLSRPYVCMLQAAKMLLFDSGCPLEMVETLIENSNESRWPPALSSSEARRANLDRIKDYRLRSQYIPVNENLSCYICVIMASDNTHMDQNIFVINPGFLIIMK